MSTNQTTASMSDAATRTHERSGSAEPGGGPNEQVGAGAARTVWLVARRELNTRVRTRAFVIGTLVTLVVAAGVPVVMSLIASTAGSTTVAVTDRSAAVAAPLARSMGDEFEQRRVSDVGEGRRLVREGDVDALITGPPGGGDLRLVVDERADEQLRTALTAASRQLALNAALAEAGADPTVVRERLSTAAVEVTALSPADPQRGQRLGMAMAAGFLLYMFLIASGQMVAQGVVEEKSSRVVEILLSTIRPTHLLGGKVLGIGLTGLLQFVTVGLAGAVAVSATGIMTLPSASLVSTLVWALVWFLLGYLFYATILAAGASLVSRQEDLQSVITPVVMLLIVPFMVGVSVLPNDPDGLLGAVLSLIPGFSPVLMPMRIALGVAAPWEIALSLALTVVATLAALWLGGRIYRNAVLRTGARVKLTDALRSA